MNFRSIGKLGFLLVIVGYLMPMFGINLIITSAQMNGFEYAQLAMEEGGDATICGILMYGFLLFAAVGVIIGALLLAKKNVPVFIDWLIILVCIAGILYVSIDAIKDGAILQTGVYIIGLGLIVALIAQIISAIRKEKQSKKTST
jgi:hypothetical protein